MEAEDNKYMVPEKERESTRVYGASEAVYSKWRFIFEFKHRALC